MDQLTKLIEQYEKKNPGKKARKSGKWAFTLDFTIWQANEIEKLSSRPTCGEEQRKFLDEIENNFLPIAPGDYEIIEHNNGDSALESWDFGEIDFEKVIKGE